MKKVLELKNISKSFDGETVLDNISLDIYDNEFITLLGPSGCGKTTTLRIIGGFEYPDNGDVIFMGEKINDLPPHKRHVNTVFQKYALFPHLNVFENVAFPLREKKMPKAEIKEKVEKMLEMVMLAYILGWIQMLIGSDFDEVDRLNIKDWFVVIGGSAIYSLVSFAFSWFERNIVITLIFAVYMVIAYLGIFLIHTMKRAIDAKLLNNDLQKFKQRDNKEC